MESKVKLAQDSETMKKKTNNNRQLANTQSGENESVNSDISSVKNAEIIAAAFNSESPKSEIFTIDFSNNKKANSDKMDEIIDPDEQDNFSTSTQSSTSILNNVSLDQDSLENSKIEDSNDSLADTIAQVASGSISSDTKKIIEDKQNDMIMKSKLNEPSGGEEPEGAKSKKSPRFRRTRKQIEIDAVKAAAAVDAAVSSLLLSPNPKPAKPRLGILVQKNFSNKRKRLLTLKNKIDFLRAKKLSKKCKQSEEEAEQDQNEAVDSQSQSKSLQNESDHDPTRTCLICEQQMNQDVLNEHVMKHFYESAKCCSCSKVSSNPANFVVHILTHLPPQFYCLKCDKWYRQGVLYKRHKQECSRGGADDEPMMNTRQKRKSSVDSIVQKSEMSETKRRRGPPSRLRVGVEEAKMDELDYVDKRRPGRPKKSDETDMDKVNGGDIKRKYTKKSGKMDMGRKKGLRSFGKKSETKICRPKRRDDRQQTSDLEWIETDSKSNGSESLSEVDNLDEVGVSDLDEEESQDDSKSKSMALTGILADSSLTHDEAAGGTLANAIATLALKPNMDLTSLSTYKVKIQPTRNNSVAKNQKNANTPSKSVNNNLANFECPECDKKFVSYFGLVQHYDQHPNLSVYCQQCDIEFENHYGLVVHNSSVHQIVESQYLKNKLKQAKKEETSVSSSGTNGTAMNLPSIMTRTSRLNTDSQKNLCVPKPNHLLEVKTTGFADLALIDFSCVNFPRIAQHLCELWPRKIANQNEQPLHNYKCSKCGFYFPCSASLKLHSMKKFSCKLFMTNSKFAEYEKSLAEMVDRLEEQLEPRVDLDDESTRDQFMSWFGLVNTAKLNEINAEQRLLEQLRAQMLDVNHEFKHDLDKWKLSHSSLSDADDSFSSKVHLKPFVNLTRPLLIRSKKFKRNTQKFVILSKSTESTNVPNKTVFTKPFFSATTSGNFSAASKKLEDKRRKSSPTPKNEINEKDKGLFKEEEKKEEEVLVCKEEVKIPEPPKLSIISSSATETAKPAAKLANCVKAPIVSIPTQCSSANSTRLASASGMNNNLTSFRPIMPKLVPINNQNSGASFTSPPPVMPKLRKHSPKAKISPKSCLKPIAPKLDSPVRHADNKSLLKCKFCMEVFNGQSEFFQHVILTHPKMVKQKLNRSSTGNSSGSSSSSSTSSSSSNGSSEIASIITSASVNGI